MEPLRFGVCLLISLAAHAMPLLVPPEPSPAPVHPAPDVGPGAHPRPAGAVHAVHVVEETPSATALPAKGREKRTEETVAGGTARTGTPAARHRAKSEGTRAMSASTAREARKEGARATAVPIARPKAEAPLAPRPEPRSARTEAPEPSPAEPEPPDREAAARLAELTRHPDPPEPDRDRQPEPMDNAPTTRAEAPKPDPEAPHASEVAERAREKPPREEPPREMAPKAAQETPDRDPTARAEPSERDPLEPDPGKPVAAVPRDSPAESEAEAPKPAPQPAEEPVVAEAPVPVPPVRAPPEPSAAAKPAAPSPEAEKAEVAQTGGNGHGTTPGGEQWVRFVRSDRPGEASPGAPTEYIGDRNLSAPDVVRAPATTRRSNGEGTGDAPVAPPKAPPAEVTTSHAGAPPAGDPLGRLARVAPSPETPEALPDPVTPLADPRSGTPSEISLPFVADADAPAPPVSGGMHLVVGPDPTVAPAPDPGPTRAPKKARRPRPKAPPAPPAEPAPPPVVLAPKVPEAPAFTDDFWGSLVPVEVGLGLPAVSGEASDAVPVLDPEDAPGWSALTILAEDVPEGEEVRVAVKDTPIGRWMVTVDEQLRAGWRCPPELLALGVTGTTRLGFRVQRDGDVTDVRLIESSQNTELDLAAFAAVPSRVLRPSSMGAPPTVRVQYTFRCTAR